MFNIVGYCHIAVDLPLDRESRQPLGYAYIWFGNEGSAWLAVKEMNGKVCIFEEFELPTT